MPESRVIAIVGEGVDDRDGHPLDAARLAALGGLLDAAYPTGLRGPFVIIGSLLVGLLADDADPILAVLRVGLLDDAPRVRWSIAATSGATSAASGAAIGGAAIGGAFGGAEAVATVPAAAGTGRGHVPVRAGASEPASEALDALAIARARRDRLIVRTGEPGADRLLDAIAPLLAELLDELTERQRPVARMLLLDGLRQADVADALGVSRATVSVMVGRGRVRSIDRLAGAVRAVTAAGLEARRAADLRPIHPRGIPGGRVTAPPGLRASSPGPRATAPGLRS